MSLNWIFHQVFMWRHQYISLSYATCSPVSRFPPNSLRFHFQRTLGWFKSSNVPCIFASTWLKWFYKWKIVRHKIFVLKSIQSKVWPVWSYFMAPEQPCCAFLLRHPTYFVLNLYLWWNAGWPNIVKEHTSTSYIMYPTPSLCLLLHLVAINKYISWRQPNLVTGDGSPPPTAGLK